MYKEVTSSFVKSYVLTLGQSKVYRTEDKACSSKNISNRLESTTVYFKHNKLYWNSQR